MQTSMNNKYRMLWGSEELYHMHIGGGNKTLMADMHKRLCVINPVADYVYCLVLFA